MRRAARPVTALPLLLGLAACSRPPAPDPAYRAEIEKARAERVKRLTAENGWLTLTGLFWLKPGGNAFGSDKADPVFLDAPGIPPRAGSFDLRPDGTVVLAVEPGAPVTVNGAAPTTAPLASDQTGKPDAIVVGRLRLTLIRRGDALAIRSRDPESPRRKEFQGIPYFPIDPRLRVEGTFEPYPVPREVEVPSAQGPAQKVTAPGVVRFTLFGKALSLEPSVEAPDDDTFFFVFRDATAGDETYGAGRFLYAASPKKGDARVVLDFNRAVNPPCAFTPYATCPLPLPQNVLPVRIEAGERTPAGH